MCSRKRATYHTTCAARYSARRVDVRLRICYDPGQCQSRLETPLNEQPHNFSIAALGYGRLQQHTLHQILRSTTSEVHTRLHNHRGVEAVTAGKTGRADCIALLRRVYGFHRPFGVAPGITTERTDWLEADLAEFGIDRGVSLALLQCRRSPTALCQATFRARVTSSKNLLPGRPRVPRASSTPGIGIEGRLVFNGHGATSGSVWHDYLTQLSSGPKARAAAIKGATAAFAILEPWLEKWDVGYE